MWSQLQPPGQGKPLAGGLFLALPVLSLPWVWFWSASCLGSLYLHLERPWGSMIFLPICLEGSWQGRGRSLLGQGAGRLESALCFKGHKCSVVFIEVFALQSEWELHRPLGRSGHFWECFRPFFQETDHRCSPIGYPLRISAMPGICSKTSIRAVFQPVSPGGPGGWWAHTGTRWQVGCWWDCHLKWVPQLVQSLGKPRSISRNKLNQPGGIPDRPAQKSLLSKRLDLVVVDVQPFHQLQSPEKPQEQFPCKPLFSMCKLTAL